MPEQRRNKENYYLDIADTVLTRGTCLRRNFGAVVVKNDQIISSGYSGSPRGRENCINRNICLRESLGVSRGERYELCRSVHAEANAIIHASRENMLDSTLYLVGKDVRTFSYVPNALPCSMCKKLIINAGIKNVIVRDNLSRFRVIPVCDWIKQDESIVGVLGY